VRRNKDRLLPKAREPTAKMVQRSVNQYQYLRKQLSTSSRWSMCKKIAFSVCFNSRRIIC